MFISHKTHLIILILVCIISRMLTIVYYIEDIDSLRFALSILDYDLSKLQPHFPGYPVFCFIVKMFHDLIDNMGIVFSLVGGVSVSLIIYYLLRFYNTNLKSSEGTFIFMIIFFNPLFWIMSNRYMPDLMGLSISVSILYYLIHGYDNDAQLEKGFFLSGVLAGVRLSYIPFIILPMLNIVFNGKLVYRHIFLFLSGILLWLIPMVYVTNIDNIFNLAEKQTSGHFFDFGGTIFTEYQILERAISFIRSIWADGLGGFWIDRSPITILLSFFMIIFIVFGRKDLAKRFKLDKKFQVLFYCVLIYSIWVFLFQNIVYKSRHILPILFFVCVVLIECRISVRSFFGKRVVYVFFLTLIIHTLIITKQHSHSTAINHLKNYIQTNYKRPTILSIPLVSYYLKTHKIQANFISVKDEKSLSKFNNNIGNNGDIIMIGEYSDLLDERFYLVQDTVLYHNPFMNQMWSKIQVNNVKIKN